ncbi:MAG: metal transporter, partial [Deltaproteobacteria bacterium CG_4_10_14_0_2_um_filter_43_8]
MIEKIIEYSTKNKMLIILFYLLLILWGFWAAFNTPVDAIPDLSDNQVIVYTEWQGRSPQVIEDQITYPLASNLQGLPKLKVVRAQSFFGYSLI